MSFRDRLHLLVYVDAAGRIQSRILAMPYDRAMQQFVNLHAGTEKLPELIREQIVPLCGVSRHDGQKWEKANG